MKLLHVDYSPLRRATANRTRAAQSLAMTNQLFLLRRQNAINNESLGISGGLIDLNARDIKANLAYNNIQAALGITRSVLSFGQTAAQFVQARNNQTLAAEQESWQNNLQMIAREELANGVFRMTADAGGNIVFEGRSERLESAVGDYKNWVDKNIWTSAGKERANKLIDGMASGVVNWAHNTAFETEINNRNNLAVSNLQQGITLGINNGGDTSAVDAQLQSMTWLPDKSRELLKRDAYHQIELGALSGQLTEAVRSAGKEEALRVLAGTLALGENQGKFNQAEIDVLKQNINKTDMETTQQTLERTLNTYYSMVNPRADANGVSLPAKTPDEAIKEIRASGAIRAGDERIVFPKLEELAGNHEWDRAFDYAAKYTGPEDLPMLQKIREGYNPGGAEYPRFGELKDGTLNRIQDYLDSRISQLVPKGSPRGGSSAGLAGQMDLSLEAYLRGEINGETAIRAQYEYIDAGGPAASGQENIRRIITGDRPGYEGIAASLQVSMDSHIKNLKDSYEKGQFTGFRDRAMSGIRDMIMEGKSPAEVRTAVQEIIKVVTADELKDVFGIIRNGVQNRVGDAFPGEKDLAEYLYHAQTGSLDEFIYKDTISGRRVFTWGAEGMTQAQAAMRDGLEAMGFDIVSGDFARQWNRAGDPGAVPEFKGGDGNAYRLMSDDGKRLYPEMLRDGKWTRIEPLKPLQTSRTGFTGRGFMNRGTSR
jgi:hypothetical protein